MEWYNSLIKPSWTPPGSVIGLIWSILYPIILIVFGYVVYRIIKGQAPAVILIPILLNVASNVAFSPLQFGLHSLPLATLDILIVLATIVWCMLAFWPYSRIASLALTPYLVWVSTASVLQVMIHWMNR